MGLKDKLMGMMKKSQKNKTADDKTADVTPTEATKSNVKSKKNPKNNP